MSFPPVQPSVRVFGITIPRAFQEKVRYGTERHDLVSEHGGDELIVGVEDLVVFSSLNDSTILKMMKVVCPPSMSPVWSPSLVPLPPSGSSSGASPASPVQHFSPGPDKPRVCLTPYLASAIYPQLVFVDTSPLEMLKTWLTGTLGSLIWLFGNPSHGSGLDLSNL